MTSIDERNNGRLSRRAALAGAAASLATVATLAGQTTGEAQTPAPTATPQPAPSLFPTPTPEPVYPLMKVGNQRPIWDGTPQPGGEWRLFVRSAGLTNFNPTAFRQDPQVAASYLDPLIRADDVTLEPKPWLAESWTWGADGLALDITLRTDVTWHDGSPLTAPDVQFSLLCHRDDLESGAALLLAVVNGVEVTSDATLTVTFDEPDGAFPFNAGALPVFNKAQYEAHWLSRPEGERTLGGFDYGDGQLLGTGPWIVEDRSDSAIRFRRNDRHFATAPHADSLTLTAEDDVEQQLDAWRTGNVDIVWPFDGARYDDFRNEPGHLVAADSTLSYFAAFNFGNPARIDPGWMASPGLREALAQVIDRQGYAESVFGGFVDVDRAGIMTQPWAIDPTVRNPRRNIIAARRLLAENGWTDWDGDGVLDSPSGDRGAFVCIVRDDASPQFLATLDALGADFDELGFELEVQRLAADVFTARWTTEFDYDLIAISLNQYAAFNEFDLFGSPWSIRRNPAGWNPGGYFNAELDEAILAYLQSWEIANMKAALTTIQRVSNDDPFALWLGFPQQPVLVQPDIAGFQPNKLWQTWNAASLWRTEKAAVATLPSATPAAD